MLLESARDELGVVGVVLHEDEEAGPGAAVEGHTHGRRCYYGVPHRVRYCPARKA
jgi:hypothetical protein